MPEPVPAILNGNADGRRITPPADIPARHIFSHMFVFAHLFCGLLLGLGFCHATHDRRAIPLCMVSSLIPDLIDKPLGLLFPVLGGGRTIFHTLIAVLIVAIITFVMVRNRYKMFGMAVVCGIFVHQVLDTMWQLPSIWAYPLFGPFPLFALPDPGYYFRLEITTPSEWVFLIATVVMLIKIFSTGPSMPDNLHVLWKVIIILLAGMGILMVVAGLFSMDNTFLAPAYSALTTGMAGILALAGTAVIVLWPRSNPVTVYYK